MEEIKELRTIYSAVELSKLLGVTRAMIYHYKDGKHEPSLKVYKRMIEILEANKLK